MKIVDHQKVYHGLGKVLVRKLTLYRGHIRRCFDEFFINVDEDAPVASAAPANKCRVHSIKWSVIVSFSVNTNTNALAALETLNRTQQSLTKTQNRVSSGLKVAGAADP